MAYNLVKTLNIWEENGLHSSAFAIKMFASMIFAAKDDTDILSLDGIGFFWSAFNLKVLFGFTRCYNNSSTVFT